MTPRDLFQLINQYIQECYVCDHTFALPTLLYHNSLFCVWVLYFPSTKTKTLMVGARFVYITDMHTTVIMVMQTVLRYFDMTLWSNIILYEDGLEQTRVPKSHVQINNPCNVLMPVRTFYFMLRFRQQVRFTCDVFRLLKVISQKYTNFPIKEIYDFTRGAKC